MICLLKNILAYDWDGIILSPGPGKPSEANSLMKILDYFHDKKPILGICLGHQAIGEYFGAELRKSSKTHAWQNFKSDFKMNQFLKKFPKK
jgi:anthranilate synthase component II